MTAGNFCQCRFRLPLIPLRLLVRSPDDSCSGHAAFFTCKHYCTSLSANMTGASALLCTRRFSFTVRAPGQSIQSFTTPISFKLSCWFAAKRTLLSTEFFTAAPNCIWPTTDHGLFSRCQGRQVQTLLGIVKAIECLLGNQQLVAIALAQCLWVILQPFLQVLALGEAEVAEAFYSQRVDAVG